MSDLIRNPAQTRAAIEAMHPGQIQYFPGALHPDQVERLGSAITSSIIFDRLSPDIKEVEYVPDIRGQATPPEIDVTANELSLLLPVGFAQSLIRVRQFSYVPFRRMRGTHIDHLRYDKRILVPLDNDGRFEARSKGGKPYLNRAVPMRVGDIVVMNNDCEPRQRTRHRGFTNSLHTLLVLGWVSPRQRTTASQ